MSGHESCDRSRPRSSLVRVIGKALCHEKRAKIRIAEPEFAIAPCVLSDLLGRVVRVTHKDLLGTEHDLDSRLETLDVEASIVVEELQQVD